MKTKTNLKSPKQLQSKIPKERSREWRRLKKLKVFEEEAYQNGFFKVAGIDEVGRGPLAGPVVAAVCHIPVDLYIAGVNDSKQLTPEERFDIYEFIVNHPQIEYGIGIINHEKIDEVNIYQASILAMLQAVESLQSKPDLLLVDGLKLPHETIKCQKIIQGDALSFAIGAASIIAKVTRDRMMIDYHKTWPEYGFDSHKGYSTPQHLQALSKVGPCPIHRRTFARVKDLLENVIE